MNRFYKAAWALGGVATAFFGAAVWAPTEVLAWRLAGSGFLLTLVACVTAYVGGGEEYSKRQESRTAALRPAAEGSEYGYRETEEIR